MVSTAKINEVIQLAIQRNQSHDAFMKKYYPEGSFPLAEFRKYNDTYEHQKAEEDAKALFAYLESLEYEDIKDIQTLMYVGRGDADSEDTEESGKVKFDVLRRYFDERGWNEDKRIEIHQMTEKLPLDEYLIQGKEELGL